MWFLLGLCAMALESQRTMVTGVCSGERAPPGQTWRSLERRSMGRLVCKQGSAYITNLFLAKSPVTKKTATPHVGILVYIYIQIYIWAPFSLILRVVVGIFHSKGCCFVYFTKILQLPPPPSPPCEFNCDVRYGCWSDQYRVYNIYFQLH